MFLSVVGRRKLTSLLKIDCKGLIEQRLENQPG